jgi:hypothetical protein
MNLIPALWPMKIYEKGKRGVIIFTNSWSIVGIKKI